jgi:2,3-dihydroxy-p-cumate/2,3-dihydroxybenzoate 3,4-dioxygenase
MTAEQLSSRVPAIQLCYVRLAVTQPQVASAFATEILGLQHVPNELEPFLFRSDERYHTLCLATRTDKPSIGIEIAGEKELERATKDLAISGFLSREATTDECAQRFVRRALIVEDATGNTIDLVWRPAMSG